jgi:hypothetical protein
MAKDNLTLEQSAIEFRSSLTDRQRQELAAFLNSPTALYELRTHLPVEFVKLAADALQRAGLD